MGKKILLTAGPIPARLDSVKYITNRFKGGLAMSLAKDLVQYGHDVTVVAWKHSGIAFDGLHSPSNFLYVDDVYDYYNKVLNFKADAYILAAAVANLGPLNPIEGKFPSHKYKEGDVFSIDFTIMPRVIDAIKTKYPTSTLIAYKLFDGTEEELIEAARHTLYDSKANVVFANSPTTAKNQKIVVTPDGSTFKVDFEQHVELIQEMLNLEHYGTRILDEFWYTTNQDDKYIIDNYPRTKIMDMTFGTFAIRNREDDGFITTTRGKKTGEHDTAYVQKVDHDTLTVYASQKATLNAPLLDMAFRLNPNIKYLIHDHKFFADANYQYNDYAFPGTTQDNQVAHKVDADHFMWILPHHGYLAGFEDYRDCVDFIGNVRKI